MSDVPPTGDDADEPIEDDETLGAEGSDGAASESDGSGSDAPDDGDADEEVVLSDELLAVGTIEPVEIQHEMEQSFLDYAMSVIVSRALPDVRDGLKPVHRRILWGMYDQGVRPDRSHVKCARVVGDVMGKYHPHGDSAIYDAMVRLGQTFSLRHPLIDPHGNFGSPSDGPAAMRYTEARLSKLAMHMLDGIDQETVDFVDNFDGQEEEPTVLPSRFPNFLVNGGQGIAVGMATNVPPHNLGEVIDATIHLLSNPEATNEDLMEHVLGPDFPTAGLILGRTGIRDAYTTGRGSIRIRGRAEIVEGKSGDQIVVTEIPYQTSVEQIEQKAAELVNRRELEGIRAIRNESAQGSIRLVFELKRDAPALVILNNLYKYTPLQGTFSVNMVALVDGIPRTLDLRSALVAYIAHQVEVVTRRTEFLLDKAQKRAHIVEGLLKALDMIDRIIAAIRTSEDRPDARGKLMSDDFGFSEIQANHILDLPLGRLTRLGRAELTEELEELTKNITYYESLLADDAKLRGVIAEEMTAIQDEFATPRRSELTYDPGSLDIEDLIDDEELVVTMSAKGYIKTTSIDAFRSQGRGGRGISGAKLRDEDYVEHLIYTSAHAYLLFFSNRGRVYRVKAHEIPQQERTARGIAIVNLLQLQPEETIQAVVDTRDYETNRFLMFATKQGQVKKTQFTAYDSSLKAGLIAINLRDGDELVRVIPTNGDDDVFLSTYKGRVLRFSESNVRPMGRSAAGVRGIRVLEGDHVVSCAVARDDAMFLLVTEQGYGKRTPIDEFTTKGRGGQGVRGIKVVEGRGGLAGARMVSEDEDVILIGTGGVIMRTAVGEISTQGRSATGVRIMNVNAGQSVAAITPAPAGEEEQELDEDGNVIVTSEAPTVDSAGDDLAATDDDGDETDIDLDVDDAGAETDDPTSDETDE